MWSLFNKALSFTKEHFKHLSIIGFCTFGIFLLISAFIRPEWLDLTSFLSFIETTQNSSNSNAILNIVELLLSIGVTIWGWAIVYYVINAETYKNSLKGFVRGFWSRFFPTLWTGIIYGILFILLIMLFIIPWVIFGIYWFVATSITLDNGPWWRAALKQSKAMITNRWREVFGINLWLGLLIAVLTWTIMYIGYIAYQSFDRNPIMDLVFNASQYLLVIFTSVFWGLLYLHLKETYVPKVSETQPADPGEVTPVETPTTPEAL